MAYYPWRQWSAYSPGLQIDGFKACPFCMGINLHFPTSSLKVASSGRPPGQLAADQAIFAKNPQVSLYNNNDPFSSQIPLDYFTLDPLDPVTGFPSYNSWRCIDCNRSFESPAFVPGDLTKVLGTDGANGMGVFGFVDYSGFTGEMLGEDRSQF